MIASEEIKPVGKFLKPHGVNGEITLLRDFDDIDFEDFSCLVVDIDGIFVPFFLNSVRPKGNDTDLVTIDGVNDELQAARFTNKTVYVLRKELEPDTGASDGEEGFYADDFIGYSVVTDKSVTLGKVTGIEDTTANYLFIVETPDGTNLLIPVAEEFIADIDPERKTLTLDLPEGLLEMQK